MSVKELEVPDLPQAAEPPRGPLGELIEPFVGPFLPVQPPGPRTPTGFYTDTTVCIGCKACEVACKQWNQLPADGLRWTGNSYDNTETLSATSWRHVKFVERFPPAGSPRRHDADGRGSGEEPVTLEALLDGAVGGHHDGRWLMMSDVCKHCEAAPCQHACPTGAIIYNEFSNVYIQPDICNGCSYCVAACPFGVITRSTLDGHSHKCTLCYDRQRDCLVPACAKACPTASIQFGPIDELRERARKRVAELQERGDTDAYLYGDAPTGTYSQLNSFYLLVDHPVTYGLPGRPFNPWLHMAGDYAIAIITGLIGIATLLAIWYIRIS
jgi:formate dehydrogenase iron-sulfur subunit